LRVTVLPGTQTPADKANEYRGFRLHENLNTIVPQMVAFECEDAVINGDAARRTGELADYEA